MRSLPILPVLPLVLLLACTPSPYRLGVRAANDGRWIDASNHWLTALDNDIYATKPRKALREHAKDAWDERLDIAREHEAARRYAASADAYREMLAYAKSLDEVELLSFSTADATSELKTVIATWAMSERARGSVAHEAGDWAVAVEAFDAARELKGDLVGLDAEQGATFAAWARADLDEHRYHDAADHFRRAFELTGDRELDAWAAAVEVGLGRYALSKNACRAAVSHFEKAGHVVGDNTLEADRARALDCSRLGLLMDPVDDATVVEGRQLSVGTMLLDRIERE
ncbi:MAG: hypothetical protein KC656_21235, partial [Myxococcales bacterium]|nr:hypothetical protein [Myxococcales bacterium]